MHRLYYIFFLFIPLLGQTQQLRVKIVDFSLPDSLSSYWQKRYCEKSECGKLQHELLTLLTDLGYIRASIIKETDESECRLLVESGMMYRWLRLDTDEIPVEVLAEFKGQLKTGMPYRSSTMDILLSKTTRHYQNRGFPFVSVKLDSIYLAGSNISGRIKVDKGNSFRFGSFETEGIKFSDRWLKRLAGIGPGEMYSEFKLEKLVETLEKQGFEYREEPILKQNEGNIDILMHFKPDRKNHIDGLVGLVGDPVRNRTVLTGFLDLSVGNLFHSGKSLAINWQRFTVLSQNLDAYYFHPWVLGKPVSLSMSVQMMKRDTSFFNRNFRGMIQLENLRFTNYGLFGGLQGSTRLSTDLQFPSGLETINTEGGFVGIHFQYHKPPWEMEVENSLLWKSPLYTEGVSSGYLESLPSTINQYMGTLRLIYKGKVRKEMQWIMECEAALLQSEYLFNGDYFWLGGSQSLRGYAEKEFQASAYTILRSELLWVPGSGTKLFLFTDHALMKSAEGQLTNLHSAGPGMEVSMAEKGLLKLNWGIGKRPGRPLAISESVIQIGFVSNF